MSKEKVNSVVTHCRMFSRCPINGQICDTCLNREEPVDGPPHEITED